MTAAPTVSAVVTHYRSPDALLACLDSLERHGGDRLTEVVVVDSEAQPGLGERLARYPARFSYVPKERNVGFGALVNEGLERTTSPHVLVLNADVRITPGAVDALSDHLLADPGCGLVAPMLRNDDGSLQQSVFRYYRPSTVAYRRTPLGRTPPGRAELTRFLDEGALRAAAERGQVAEADWVLGAAMCVRREAVTDVGPMDADYFLYFEDVDWCRRFWAAGWSVHYLPAAVIEHSHARASAAPGLMASLRNPLTRRHLRSSVRYFRKHGLSSRRPVAVAMRTAEPVIDLREAPTLADVEAGALRTVEAGVERGGAR